MFSVEAGAFELLRELQKKWHPDKNSHPSAASVFAHINKQYEVAQTAWANGGYPNTLMIKTSTGVITYPYLAVMPFELGEVYICPRHIIWATRREFDDLAKRWLESVKRYTFPNDEVKGRIAPFVPRNSHTVANKDRAYTILDRPRDYIRVADILRVKGPMPVKHVAWTLTRAYNLAGFLNYAGIAHLGINADTFFIEPSTHHGALLGGWFYTGEMAGKGKRYLAAPSKAAHLIKAETVDALDIQIRAMGRQLLGATSPVSLRANPDVPDPMKNWLLGAPLDSPPLMNQGWLKVITDSFGKRNFTQYPLTTAEIYGDGR